MYFTNLPKDEEKKPVIFESIFNNFKTLWGDSDPKHEHPFGEDNGIPILTETHFVKNMHLLTGDDTPATEYFGKILYLYLSQGLDHAKITIKRFFDGMAPFAYEDNKAAQQKLSF